MAKTKEPWIPEALADLGVKKLSRQDELALQIDAAAEALMAALPGAMVTTEVYALQLELAGALGRMKGHMEYKAAKKSVL